MNEIPQLKQYGVKFRTARIPNGKNFIWRKFRKVKTPYGEKSIRRKIYGGHSYGENSYCENSSQDNDTAVFYKTTHYHHFIPSALLQFPPYERRGSFDIVLKSLYFQFKKSIDCVIVLLLYLLLIPLLGEIKIKSKLYKI